MMNSNECKHDWRFKRRKLLFVPAIIAIGLIKAGVVLFLWNELIPEIFHGPTLTYLQAIELLILAKVLIGFGGFRGHHHGHRHGGDRFWKEKWMNLSPEEREKMRDELHKRHQR
jgi:hypothetical protein